MFMRKERKTPEEGQSEQRPKCRNIKKYEVTNPNEK